MDISKFLGKAARYNKAIVAFLAACGVLGGAIAPTDLEAAWHITGDEAVQILIAFGGVVGVYQVANKK